MRGSAGGVPLNIPADQAPAWYGGRGNAEIEAFGVLPENWDAALAFIKCSTQWRRDRAGALAGLDYPALELVMKHQKCADPDDAFLRVQVMEGAAVEQSRRMVPRS